MSAVATPAAKDHIVPLMRRLRSLPDTDYVANLIAYHAAPTLLGIKPATLICPDAKGRNLGQALNDCVPYLARTFGVTVVSFRNGAGARLFLVYHPALLRSALAAREVLELLAESGYDARDASVESLLATLRRKCSGRHFPHEIGVFLGYPPSDVRCFIQNGGKQCRARGHWKAYGDEEEARRRFEHYSMVKQRAAELIVSGACLRELADGLRSLAA